MIEQALKETLFGLKLLLNNNSKYSKNPLVFRASVSQLIRSQEANESNESRQMIDIETDLGVNSLVPEPFIVVSIFFIFSILVIKLGSSHLLT